MLQTNDYIFKEQETIERFLKSALDKPPFYVKPHVRWYTTVVSEFDMLIRYKDSINLAVVEIKNSLKNQQTFELAKQKINDAFLVLNCHFGIITDNTDFYICESDNKDKYQKHSFDDIVHTILNHKFVHNLRYDQISSTINNVLKNNGLDSFIGCYEENDEYLYFNDFEDYFWKQLLKPKKKYFTIYRYTSLDTAFLILKNKTYRMYGIAGMNDKSEVDYFDDYCYSTKIKLSYQILNNLFLSSCSLLNDNLTMWRLYGDDAKGACLVFEMNSDSQTDFILQSISYANEQKIDVNLDIIKQLLQNNVVFKNIDKWKHFFKAKDYSIEKEVRLIFQDNGKSSIVKNRDWIRSNDYSIINPYVEFDIFNTTKFPLQLKEIILGPKCPEQETNKYQLQELIRQQKLSINVRASDIKNYR